MRPSRTRGRSLGARGWTLALGCVLAGCPKPPTPSEPAPEPVELPVDEAVDAPALCQAGCAQLARCVPELATELDGDPEQVAERLAGECESACAGFEDQRSSLALRDCLALGSCPAYWGCVSAPNVQPWLATVAPAGERSCANLCSQASACAIAKVCELDQEAAGASAPADARSLDPACMQDEIQRAELEEVCLLQCEATPEQGQARAELIGCIDHASCDGMLRCLDGWSATDYGEDIQPVPGVSPTCDAFCTRAIVCGAAEEELELQPEELEELKQRMTSTYIECAVQCAKDFEPGSDADKARTQAAFEACTASEDCEAFTACAKEV